MIFALGCFSLGLLGCLEAGPRSGMKSVDASYISFYLSHGMKRVSVPGVDNVDIYIDEITIYASEPCYHGTSDMQVG